MVMPIGCRFEQQDMKITNDVTIIYDVVRGSNDDGTLDDTNMKTFDQDTAANLTFYDASLKE